MRLAAAVAGAGQDERQLLETLCFAAEAEWTSRLREGVAPEDCGKALPTAAAFTAAAGLAAAGEEGPVAFTAGTVSVRNGGARDRGERSRLLLEAARQLMAPYTDEGGFAFLGVRG